MAQRSTEIIRLDRVTVIDRPNNRAADISDDTKKAFVQEDNAANYLKFRTIGCPDWIEDATSVVASKDDEVLMAGRISMVKHHTTMAGSFHRIYTQRP